MYTVHCTLYTVHCTLYSVHIPIHIHEIRPLSKYHITRSITVGLTKCMYHITNTQYEHVIH